MYKIILMTLLLGITAFAQDKPPGDNVPLWMAENKIVVRNMEKNEWLVLDFSGKEVKSEGKLDPKEAYRIMMATIGIEVNGLRRDVDSLIVVKNYLQEELRRK